MKTKLCLPFIISLAQLACYIEQSEHRQYVDANDYEPVLSFKDLYCSSHEYELQVDPSYSEQDLKQIVSAWSDWMTALGDIPVRITFPEKIDASVYEACKIKLINKPAPINYDGWTHGIYDGGGFPSSVKIWIASGFSAEQMYSVSAHEFGHSLGLTHSTNESAIMFNPAPIPGHISEEDRRRACTIWGC